MARAERPFEKGDPEARDAEARWPQLTARPKPIAQKVSPAIAELVMSCLEYDPGKRPTAAELSAEFEPVLAALPRPWISS